MRPGTGNRAVAAVLGLGLALTAPGAAVADGNRPATVRDLHYGEALFAFYQRDWFHAITLLAAADAKNRLTHHRDEARLLLGGVYVSYGLRDEAEAIFSRLLDQTLDGSARDRAWFYLAKLSFQRGQIDAARQAIDRIGDDIDPVLAPQLALLDAAVLMAGERYAEAARRLDRWRAPRAWRAYADINLGTALVRAGSLDAGARLLDAVGTMRTREDEYLGLRDKANVALGFALLASDQAGRARPVLERVRLNGPFSNKALLGLGWARAAGDDYRGALSPWLELSGRSGLDAAVHEALLAVPYAYGRLGADGRALTAYNAAIAAYETEIARLGDAADAVRNGALETLLAGAQDGPAGWFWSLDDIDGAPEAAYLYPLLSRHAFQEALKDWRDLAFLSNHLADWSARLGVFETMIVQRRAGFTAGLSVAAGDSRAQRLAAVRERTIDLADRIAAIEADNDTVALASKRENALLGRLDGIDERLSNVAGRRPVDDLARKARLYRGLLTWDLSQQFPQRLWDTKKALRDVGTRLDETNGRYADVAQAIDIEPQRLAALDIRVRALGPRIAALKRRVDAALAGQGELLVAQAGDALDAERDRLTAYLTQARFAVAISRDRAAGSMAASEQAP